MEVRYSKIIYFENIMLIDKPDKKCQILYGPTYMKYLEQTNL